jgi:hypothetical protein
MFWFHGEMLTHGVTFHSKKEFNYAELKRGGQKMVAVVMQARCRNAREWLGAVGMILGSSLYVDFSSPSTWSDPAEFDAKVDELSQTIFAKVSRSPVQEEKGLPALLASLNLTEYVAKLHEEGADQVSDLEGMSLDDLLTEFGMKRYHAKRLHQALHQTPASPSANSPPAVKQNQASPPPAVEQKQADAPTAKVKPAPSHEWVQKAKNPDNLFKAVKENDV